MTETRDEAPIRCARTNGRIYHLARCKDRVRLKRRPIGLTTFGVSRERAPQSLSQFQAEHQIALRVWDRSA